MNGCFGRPLPPSFIYFLTADVEDFPYPIKIGVATNFDRRMASYKTHTPWPVKVLALIKGTLNDEKKLHKRFDHLRMEGEWFERGSDLMDYIQSIAPPELPFRVKVLLGLE